MTSVSAPKSNRIKTLNSKAPSLLQLADYRLSGIQFSSFNLRYPVKARCGLESVAIAKGSIPDGPRTVKGRDT
jgi:hypothetical protein